MSHDYIMTKNITFTADAALIEEAREVARAESTTLNEQFRIWLEQYARAHRAAKGMEIVDRIQGYASSGGLRFTREERNER